MTDTTYCQHCLPAKRKHHITSHLEYYFRRLANTTQKAVHPLMPAFMSPELVWRYILRMYCKSGVAEFTDSPDTSQLYNRSKIFFDTAKERGIPIEVFTFGELMKHEFRFQHNGRHYYFDHIPLAYRFSEHQIDDKKYVREYLQQSAEIPVPRGNTLKTKRAGMNFANTVGFPLVVKPAHGSLSCHATYPVEDEAELESAIDIAKEYQPAYVIEEFIEGGLYRASVLGKETVFVCKKERPNVIGDGNSTIEELIEEKNDDPVRAAADRKDATLHTITVNDILKNTLHDQGMELESVPDNQERVILHPKYTLAAGCDIIECTEKVHPQNMDLFRNVAEQLNANIIGIDFICPDITTPYTKQKTGIIETNSRPYVDMHQHPSSGTPKDVANIGWDIVLEQLSDTKNN